MIPDDGTGLIRDAPGYVLLSPTIWGPYTVSTEPSCYVAIVRQWFKVQGPAPFLYLYTSQPVPGIYGICFLRCEFLRVQCISIQCFTSKNVVG
ncbi:uncharacterized protein BO96DRAFT_54022 [Aspergillus niger CBS 101883]|uniref:Uncharacterized protein n=2 Tax=Aspergillus niger TaxID=5061 RepID=A2QQ90_ASPNC|nr:uncharacterized protein BO96DRAFT_54022 [Aspergillus niger CBS 101883]XP_059601155.1 hypothetical protein An08g01670 [Aspergillus niger]PYH56252.1 hypothetical protein BO96DRAFT_54022 [Aspergillus niger CBS 101883]CAK39847.1 hypothetical protein An08g01670 [Aspergillus niger]